MLPALSILQIIYILNSRIHSHQASIIRPHVIYICGTVRHPQKYHNPLNNLIPRATNISNFTSIDFLSTASGTFGRCPKEPSAPARREAGRRSVRPLCLSCPRVKHTDSRAYTSLLISITR